MTSGLLAPRRVGWFAATGLLCAALPASAEDWPSWRGDPERTAVQPLPADIDLPAVQWSIPVGGSLAAEQFAVADVDLDGREEVVLVRGGRAVARRFDGTLVWATEPLALAWISAVTDFDGDGRLEVFAGSTWTGLFAIDGTTGALRWRSADTTGGRLHQSSAVPFDREDDGRLELYLADWGCAMSGGGGGRIFAFPAGWAGDPVVTPLDTSAHGYWCGLWQDLGDVDGDGDPDVVTLGHDRIVVYDSLSGTPLAWVAAGGPFPYGIAVTSVADIDADDRAEIVVASDNPGTAGRRLIVAEFESGELRIRWQVTFDAGGVHRFLRDLVADLIPGGPPEILTSRYEPAAGWAVQVFAGDAAAPVPVVEIPGRALVAAARFEDLPGDALLLRPLPGASTPRFGTVEAHRLSAGPGPAAERLWSVEQARVPVVPAPWHHGEAAAVGGAPAGGSAAYLFLDPDRDSRAEELRAVDRTGTTVASRSFSAAAFGAGLQLAPTTPPQPVVARTDGSIERLAADLRLVNDDATPMGVADLVETNHGAIGLVSCRSSAGRLLAVVDAGARLRVHRTDAGTPEPPLLWQSERNVVSGTVLFLRDGSDGCNLLMLLEWLPGGGVGAAAFDAASGAPRGESVLSDRSTTYPFFAPLPLYGAAGLPVSVVFPLRDAQSDRISYLAVDPSGTAVEEFDLGYVATGGGDGYTSAHDWNRDGIQDLVVVQGTTLRVADGITGARLAEVASFGTMGLLVFQDLDADGAPDALHHDLLAGPARFDLALTRRWASELGPHEPGPALAGSTGGVIAAPRYRSARLDGFDSSDGTNLWSVVLAGGSAYPDEAAAEAAGATPGVLGPAAGMSSGGRADALLGATDGFLYAVDGESGATDWSLDLRAAVGEPLAADIDGDGASEVVVAAGDGEVHAVASAAVAAPSAVYDTDGSFVALSPADDLDEIADASTVGGNWPAAPGAVGYDAQIVREDGLVVAPWIAVDGTTRVVWTDLSLQTDWRYHLVVRARGNLGGVPSVSAEVRSDGFVVVDRDPPLVAVDVAPSPFRPDGSGGPAETVVSVVLTDRVGLRRFETAVRNEGGEVVRDFGSVEVGGREHRSSFPWDGRDGAGDLVPPGTYRVRVVALDLADREAEGEAPVVVCDAAGDETGLCPPADPDAGDDGDADGEADFDVPADDADGGGDEGEADGEPGAGWSGSGGGCGCRAGGGGTGGAVWAALALLVGLGRMRRRRPGV